MSEVALAPGELGSARFRQRRIPWLMLTCLILLGGIAVIAATGSLLAPQDPHFKDFSNINARPSANHLLGTDLLGQDVLSRVIAGARSAVLGPLVIALGSGILGSILGLMAGYRGGRTDAVIMRWVDLMWAIPGLLILIVVGGAFGGGYWLAVGLLILLTTPFDARVVRNVTLEQTPRAYVEATRTLGVSDRRIMLFHIWPNVMPTVVANSFLVFAGALISLAGLSYLGLGSRIGTPDWGLMLSDGRGVLVGNPVAALAPGVMIVLTAASMNLVGDWIYERLSSRGAVR